MATFIPEWNKVSGRHLHVKRVLNVLNDQYVVRRPIKPERCPTDLFVQHSVKGWLAVGIVDTAFALLDPMQLFAAQGQRNFEQYLENLRSLGCATAHDTVHLNALVVLWSCSNEQAGVLTGHYAGLSGIRLLSREQFVQSGAAIIDEQLTGITGEFEHTLLGAYFPEAEIAAVSTTRRLFHRDNSAKLGRFFLDREQESASKLDLEGPDEQNDAAKDLSVRLINGVAGSGKTLIAISRALMLADLYPDQRLLMLIHNTPVVADIHYRLARARGTLPPNLEISTFYRWIVQNWRRLFGGIPRIAERQPALAVVRSCRRHWADLKQSDDQLLDEIDFINQVPLNAEAAYQEASRAGRRFALGARERSQVWALYQAVSLKLRETERRLWSDLARDILLAEDKREQLPKYHHVLVDEAQFFAPSWFHVIRQSIETEGQLFMCVDPTQGFMKSRLSWKSVGLDVAGRTRKLRKSYRTTKAILVAANSVLAVLGQSDSDDYLEPDFSTMISGTRPLLIGVDTPQDGVDRVVNEVQCLCNDHNTSPGDVLVIYGKSIPKASLYEQLGRRLGANNVWWLNRDEHKKLPPAGHDKDYLRIANVDTATGLEAGTVFLVGVEALLVDREMVNLSETEREERIEENARKLYMAMTRAGKQLVLVSAERIPEQVKPFFEQAS